MAEINNKKYWQLLHLRVSEKRVNEAVAFFRENDIEPILIKGWWAAQFYAEPFDRYFMDVDLVFSQSDYRKAKRIAGNYRGFLPIDLHCELRHLDTVAYENLFANSILVKCGEIDIRVLRPEDHLRVLCVHWLTDGGANRRRLWDIYYAVANRPADFDWARCLETVSPTRQKWILYTIELAHKYLGLSIADTPAAGMEAEIPGWIIETVEKEWAENVILTPLQYCLNDRRRLWQQLKKRFPPNPITATVDMEGEFDNRTRIFYQVGDFWQRLKPSVRRLFNK